MPDLALTPNPILAPKQELVSFDMSRLQAPTLFERPHRATVRELRDCRRVESAEQAIAGNSVCLNCSWRS